MIDNPLGSFGIQQPIR